jgi:hypothetical protein
MTQIFRITALAATLFIAPLAGAANGQSASPDDTARVLAGLRPSAGSQLLPLTQSGAWQTHADRFNALFANADNRQLKRIRAWSSAKLKDPSPVLFYMFSGPDFLYANAFFPNASTYVMAGLEPTGPIPDLSRFSRESLGSGLRGLEVSLRSILTVSFFITKQMRSELNATRMNGTLPILYVFLARSGKTIREASLFRLDQNGMPQPENTPGLAPNAARGAKIVFTDADGREKTLYYFSTNIANDGFKASGFAKFLEGLGTGDAFVKSASYLLHSGGFSDMRNFLLAHSKLLLQDDTGVPVAYFDQAKWQLRPFGRYAGPISIFAQHYQPKMARLFGHSDPIDFGVGYQWRNPNLLAAVRTGAVASDAPANVPLPAAAASGDTKVISESASEATAADAEETKSVTSKPARKQAAGPKRTRKVTNHYAAPWFSWNGGFR